MLRFTYIEEEKKRISCMKTLLVISNTMNQGGAETFIMKIYRALDKSKYQFDFYIMGSKGYYDEEILRLGGKITYGPMKTKGFHRYKKALKKFLSETNYQYVYKAIANSISALDLYFVRRAKKARTIVARSMIGKHGRALIHTLFRPIANTFSTTKIAPSTEAATFMFGPKTVKKRKATLLNNGLDTALFRFDLEKRNNKRQELNICEDDLLYIHIGRFSAQKNHSFLVETFAAINNENRNAHLICVGEGELKQAITASVAEKGLSSDVTFLQNRSDINELLMAADMLLLPSLFEGLPNVVIEAQATGLPCLVSNLVSFESKVTNLVTFLSIDEKEVWATEALKKENFHLPNDRTTFDSFPSEFDTSETVRSFIRLAFDD